MLSLKGRQDKYRVLFPKEFIPEEIEQKYTQILQQQRSFIISPIDFLNETVQRVEVLGFNDATIAQSQPRTGEPMFKPHRIKENAFMHGAADTIYRSSANPEALIDKTINITFRHTLGFLNYFIIFESFLYQYSRDMNYKDMMKELNIELLSHKGSIFSKIVLKNPIIEGMDMLSLDYTKPVAQSDTFTVTLKYSDFDYQFIEADRSNYNGEVE